MSRSLVRQASFAAATLVTLVSARPAAAQASPDGIAFGGAGAAITTLGGRAAYAWGGAGGENIGDHLALGIGGFGIASRDADASGANLRGGAGGVVIGVHTGSTGFQFTSSTLFAIGAFERVFAGGPASPQRTSALIAQPSVGVLLPAVSHLRIGLDVAWRAVAASRLPGISNRSLSGAAVMVTLQYWTS